MRTQATCLPTLIEAGDSIRIVDGEGTTVYGRGGAIWITQAGDPRDVVLQPGQSFTLDRNGLTLLVALHEPAVAQIVRPQEAKAAETLVGAGLGRAALCPSPAERLRAYAH